MINGVAHGPNAGTATCQLHMRSFRDGDQIYVEPWRARAMPVIRDLVVDRSALDRIIAAGGFISAPTGGAPDGNTTADRQAGRWTPRWTPRSASAAAPASRPARTAPPRSSPPPRSPTSACCRRASRSGFERARRMVAADGPRGLRRLHALSASVRKPAPRQISIDTITTDEPRLPPGEPRRGAARRPSSRTDPEPHLALASGSGRVRARSRVCGGAVTAVGGVGRNGQSSPSNDRTSCPVRRVAGRSSARPAHHRSPCRCRTRSTRGDAEPRRRDDSRRRAGAGELGRGLHRSPSSPHLPPRVRAVG